MKIKNQNKTINKGFTFVETMIVLALFAIIGASLFSSMAMGLKIWKRAGTSNFSHRKATLSLERLSAELRQTANYSSIGFYGEKNHLEFPNIVRDKIFNISYTYSPEKKCVVRGSIPKSPAEQTEAKNTTRTVMVDVKDFVLGFYGPSNETGNFTFLDSWNSTKSGIPSAVKVSLTLEDGKGFEKVITIPIAQ